MDTCNPHSVHQPGRQLSTSDAPKHLAPKHLAPKHPASKRQAPKAPSQHPTPAGAAATTGRAALRSILQLVLVAVVMTAAWSLAGWAVGTDSAVAEVDRTLLTHVQNRVDDVQVRSAEAVTLVGDTVTAVVVVAVVAVGSWWRWRRPHIPCVAIVAFVGSMAVTGLAKMIADRPRPDEAPAEATSGAFPSGHTVRGVIVCGIVAWLILRFYGRRPSSLTAVTLLAMLAVSVAASRIVLGAHWPSDVIAGVLLGVVWLAATFRAEHLLRATDQADHTSSRT